MKKTPLSYFFDDELDELLVCVVFDRTEKGGINREQKYQKKTQTKKSFYLCVGNGEVEARKKNRGTQRQKMSETNCKYDTQTKKIYLEL